MGAVHGSDRGMSEINVHGIKFPRVREGLEGEGPPLTTPSSCPPSFSPYIHSFIPRSIIHISYTQTNIRPFVPSTNTVSQFMRTDSDLAVPKRTNGGFFRMRSSTDP